MTSTETPGTDEGHRHREYTIIVDGQKKEVPSDIVTYEQVVELAYPGQSGDPQYTFTVTYRHATEEKHDGTLLPGKTVRVKKEGTVLNVTRTTKS
jgi:hypothetical protein